MKQKKSRGERTKKHRAKWETKRRGGSTLYSHCIPLITVFSCGRSPSPPATPIPQARVSQRSAWMCVVQTRAGRVEKRKGIKAVRASLNLPPPPFHSPTTLIHGMFLRGRLDNQPNGGTWTSVYHVTSRRTSRALSSLSPTEDNEQ